MGALGDLTCLRELRLRGCRQISDDGELRIDFMLKASNPASSL